MSRSSLALTLIATTISNNWGQVSIVVGLVVMGLAQGCIVMRCHGHRGVDARVVRSS